MPNLMDATSPVKAIFALDVVTAVLAFVLFGLATTLIFTRLGSGYQKPGEKRGSDGAPLKSTFATQLFLTPALFCLAVAYAILSAVVALQVNVESPASVTAAYDYHYVGLASSLSRPSQTSDGQSISILTFTNELAAIFFTVLLTGAVWLHSSNLTNNGTGVAQPSMLSKLWNSFILLAMLAIGIVTWALGLHVRGSGQSALSYPNTIDQDQPTRIVFILFRCLVIVASGSVSIEVIRKYIKLNNDGTPGNPERPILARFTFVVVPLIWLRDAFIIVNIVLLYINVSGWSSTSGQAVAFLLIIFGQLTNLTILFMVLWGARSMGRSAGVDA